MIREEGACYPTLSGRERGIAPECPDANAGWANRMEIHNGVSLDPSVGPLEVYADAPTGG